MAKTVEQSYREDLGFSSQVKTIDFLGGKDVKPEIDTEYIAQMLDRLSEITKAVNDIVHEDFKIDDINVFCSTHIQSPYELMRVAEIIPKLNNQGRRPEKVLFSWLRGHAMLMLLKPSITTLFNVPEHHVEHIGDDNFESLETFKRSAKADLKILSDPPVIIEFQAGFQREHDIKKHKWEQAQKVHDEEQLGTICIHFDVFNGRVAFIRLDQMRDDQNNWVTRQQMEGQAVRKIADNEFKWLITDPLPTLDSLDLNL